jgi:hypothetical protein
MNQRFKSLTELKAYFQLINKDMEINLTRLNITTCPYCNSLQTMGNGINSMTHVLENNNSSVEVNHTCTNQSCSRSFIDLYNIVINNISLTANKIHTLKDLEIETEDFVLFFARKGEKEVFSRFHPIYSEAMDALKSGMEDASGVLLRKCLEALIYDYIKFGAKIKGKPIDIRILQKQGLMKSVETIEDVALKELAKRAVWIGNDNVHTNKKWNHFDSDDLDRLLGAIVLNIYAKIECLIYLRRMNKR